MSEISRFRWRCRRGMREMDLLLQRFVEGNYDTLTEAEKAAFEQLLDHPDPDIMNWITGRTDPPDGPVKQVIEIMRRINNTSSSGNNKP